MAPSPAPHCRPCKTIPLPEEAVSGPVQPFREVNPERCWGGPRDCFPPRKNFFRSPPPPCSQWTC